MADIAYTTETNLDPIDHTGDYLPVQEDDYWPVDPRDYLWEEEGHCFACGRHTDHVSEHDDLVDAGKAFYSGFDVKVYGRDNEGNLITKAQYEEAMSHIDAMQKAIYGW